MAKGLLIPSFQSEEQEARWWNRHRKGVEAEFMRLQLWLVRGTLSPKVPKVREG